MPEAVETALRKTTASFENPFQAHETESHSRRQLRRVPAFCARSVGQPVKQKNYG